MYRTVRIQAGACGIICDVRRRQVATWVAAWAVGAALALLVAWLGVTAVVRNTTEPVVPVVTGSAIPPGLVAGPGGATSPASGELPGPADGSSPPESAAARPGAHAPGRPSSPAGASPAPSASPGQSSAPAPLLGILTYNLTGGQVTLDVTASLCVLVAATPDPGYSVENWSSLGWLRVDFDQDGNEASSLICDWYQQAPTITIGS